MVGHCAAGSEPEMPCYLSDRWRTASILLLAPDEIDNLLLTFG
jgi:hypothetical protein